SAASPPTQETFTSLLPFRTDSLPTFWVKQTLSVRHIRGSDQFDLAMVDDPTLPYGYRFTQGSSPPGIPSSELDGTIRINGPDTLQIRPFQGQQAGPWLLEIPLLKHPGQTARLIRQKGKQATIEKGIDTYGLLDGVLQGKVPTANVYQDSVWLELAWDSRQSLSGFRLYPVQANESNQSWAVEVWGSKNGRKFKPLGDWEFSPSPDTTLLEGKWNTGEFRRVRLIIRTPDHTPMYLDEWELVE
ncbi:MAG: hypothetical protein AAFV07_15670, partial [Bacteroidota bacterium]